jgi:hypothetical protein
MHQPQLGEGVDLHLVIYLNRSVHIQYKQMELLNMGGQNSLKLKPGKQNTLQEDPEASAYIKLF